MKYMLASLLVMLSAAAPAWAQRPVTFEANLILASNDPAPLDYRLDRVTTQLKRMFKFEHYRRLGGGSTSTALPASFSISLGAGQELKIQAEQKDGRVRAAVVWMKDGQAALNTTVGMKPGAHAILGGPPHGNGTLIVTLLAQ